MTTTATITSRFPEIISVGTTQCDLTLDPTRLYTVFHTGKSSTGGASAVDVFALLDGTTGAVDTDYSSTGTSGVGKGIIQSGVSFPLPHGITKAQFKVASGTVAVQVIPGYRANYATT